MGNERVISEFMQNHYTDEKLAALLAHAEDGKLVHASCDMKSPLEFCYRQAYFAGKAAGKRESLGSPQGES